MWISSLRDEHYYFSTLRPGHGRACKWRLGPGFAAGLDAMLQAKREREAAIQTQQKIHPSLTVTAEPPQALPRGPGMARRPVLVLGGRVFDRQAWLEAEELMDRLRVA